MKKRPVKIPIFVGLDRAVIQVRLSTTVLSLKNATSFSKINLTGYATLFVVEIYICWEFQDSYFKCPVL